MINEVKARLASLVDSGVLTTLAIASDIDAEAMENFEPQNMPSVLLYYGRRQYEATEHQMVVRQIVNKRIVVVLHCETASVDDIETAITTKLLGLKKDQAHYGMQAVDSVTVKLEGAYCCRRLEFSSETRVSQE